MQTAVCCVDTPNHILAWTRSVYQVMCSMPLTCNYHVQSTVVWVLGRWALTSGTGCELLHHVHKIHIVLVMCILMKLKDCILFLHQSVSCPSWKGQENLNVKCSISDSDHHVWPQDQIWLIQTLIQSAVELYKVWPFSDVVSCLWKSTL
jgi:hypothetical protein